MMRLVFASSNLGKVKEVQAILAGVRVETLQDHPEVIMPPETEPTFEGNARLKAEHVSQVLGVPALADDSGLEVDALHGAPGVISARYGPGTDADRTQKLLTELRDVPDEARTARFRCAMAFSVPGEPTQMTEGTCEGSIARSPRGTGGFGYDPVFVLTLDQRTMAELTPEEKNTCSHRARALAKMRAMLERYFSLVREQGE